MQDESDDAFEEALVSLRLPRWDHRTHLRVAWLHLWRYGRRGRALVDQRIRAFIHGAPITRGAGGRGR